MKVLIFTLILATSILLVSSVDRTNTEDYEFISEDEYMFVGAPKCRSTKKETGSSGVFTDGSSEHELYADDQQTCIHIQPSNVPSTSRVKLFFHRLDVEDGYDFVRIFDLDTNKILDDDADFEVTYYSKKGFIVNFVTDENTAKTGFSGRYAVETADPSNPSADEISLNLLQKENHQSCNCQFYRSGGALMARRACPFKLSLSNHVEPKHFKFILRDTKGSKPVIIAPGKSNRWKVKCEKVGRKYQFTFPIDASIGMYQILAYAQNGKVIGDAATMYMLFNPYHKDDQVYMSHPSDRAEYVESIKGLVYTSNYPKGWNFGFDDLAVVDASFKAIRALNEDQRRDAVSITREVSYVANNEILYGRWDGKYSDGKSPSHWSGSDTIIRQWWSSQKIVKYGQCWVFSGLVQTITRAFGIPTRSVTNINSAHERKPFNTICSTRYIEKEDSIGPEKEDKDHSVWNFHVWNEGWFNRKDMNMKKQGWNAYDGTAQEESDDKFQCGPATISEMHKASQTSDPMKYIKDNKLKYDLPFILGETNCLLRKEVKREGSNEYVPFGTPNDCHVGSATLTKKPQANTHMDVSLCYKKETCRRGSCPATRSDTYTEPNPQPTNPQPTRNRCEAAKGKCGDKRSHICKGSKFTTGLCPGGSHNQCCIGGQLQKRPTPPPSNGNRCERQGGKCGNFITKRCSGGRYVRGRCPGSWNNICCTSGNLKPRNFFGWGSFVERRSKIAMDLMGETSVEEEIESEEHENEAIAVYDQFLRHMISAHQEKPVKAGEVTITPKFPTKVTALDGKDLKFGCSVSGPPGKVVVISLSVIPVNDKGLPLVTGVTKSNKKGIPVPAITTETKVVVTGQSKGVAEASMSFNDYKKYLGETLSFKVYLTGKVKDGKKSDYFSETKMFSFAPPPLLIDSVEFRVGERAKTRITWANPLPIPLKNCKLSWTISGSGENRNAIIQIGQIAANAKQAWTIEIKSSEHGEQQISASLVADNLADVVGRATIAVNEKPKSALKKNVRKGSSGRKKCGVHKQDVGRKKQTKVQSVKPGKISKARQNAAVSGGTKLSSKKQASKLNKMKNKRRSGLYKKRVEKSMNKQRKKATSVRRNKRTNRQKLRKKSRGKLLKRSTSQRNIKLSQKRRKSSQQRKKRNINSQQKKKKKSQQKKKKKPRWRF